MSEHRTFHMIEAVAGRLEGAPREVRRWSDEFKAQAVAESMEPGASVSAVARRIGIEPSQLFTWRRNARLKAEAVVDTARGVIPPKFRVIVTHRPKYAFKNEDGVIQASAPAHIVESGIPTEALLAQIAVSKYGDGFPRYRQEAIFLRDHVEVDRGIMARWMGKLGFELEILADYTFSQIKRGERIFADET